MTSKDQLDGKVGGTQGVYAQGKGSAKRTTYFHSRRALSSSQRRSRGSWWTALGEQPGKVVAINGGEKSGECKKDERVERLHFCLKRQRKKENGWPNGDRPERLAPESITSG